MEENSAEAAGAAAPAHTARQAPGPTIGPCHPKSQLPKSQLRVGPCGLPRPAGSLTADANGNRTKNSYAGTKKIEGTLGRH